MVCPPGFVPTCPSTRRLAFAGAARRIATAACRQRPLSSVFPLGAPARRISPTASASSGRPPPPPPAWTPSPDLDVAPTLDAVAWSDAGLVPAIAQQYDTREVLMMAWMSRESLAITLRTGVAVYYSRSRGALWRKGESSGQTQAVVGLTVDCDGDTVLGAAATTPTSFVRVSLVTDAVALSSVTPSRSRRSPPSPRCRRGSTFRSPSLSVAACSVDGAQTLWVPRSPPRPRVSQRTVK